MFNVDTNKVKKEIKEKGYSRVSEFITEQQKEKILEIMIWRYSIH